MFHISCKKYFFTKLLKNFKRALKVKTKMETFLDFSYCSSYLQIKETAGKRGEEIFSEPRTLRSSLVEFKNFLIKIKQLLKFDSLFTHT